MVCVYVAGGSAGGGWERMGWEFFSKGLWDLGLCQGSKAMTMNMEKNADVCEGK